MGVNSFDLILKHILHAEDDQLASLNSLIKKTNATDNTEAILAEAVYIFNNPDLFVADEELMAA